MQPTILAIFLEFSRTAFAMAAAGIAMLVVGAAAARSAIGKARGLDKVVALTNLCFALPLAVFGAEHFSIANSITRVIPPYMPWKLFWAYFVGVALVGASLSIALKIQVRWSGLLFGIMMFLFVAMIHLPGAIATGNRIIWTIVFRETSFGAGGWVLAGAAMLSATSASKQGEWLIRIGRTLIAITAIVFGVLHFLHPHGLPGVPLEKQMDAWVPAQALIDYLTGAFLVVGGLCFLLNQKTRIAATLVGGWLLLMVLVIYGPVLIGGLANPSTAIKVEALNYFADTLLFAAAILSLAQTDTPRHSS